jgi:hypothetical protein
MRLTLLLLVCVLTTAVLPSYLKASAASTSNINATVKISVCGNGDVEGGEDCDGENLNGKTCSSFGYKSGVLSCDVSCSFNAVSCSNDSSATSTSTSSPAVTGSPTNTITLAPTQTSIPVVENDLPTTIQQLLSVEGVNSITIETLPTILRDWVASWKVIRNTTTQLTEQRSICDVNKDNNCDLRDFSLIMYYTGK